MTKVDELTAKIKDMHSQGMQNFNISWAPEAAELNPEERAAAVLEVIAAVEKHDALPVEEKMHDDIKIAYEDMKYALNMLSYNRLSDVSKAELERRISKAWGALDIGLMHLGNWLTKAEKSSMKEAVIVHAALNNASDLL